MFFSVFGVLPGAALFLDVLLPKVWVAGCVDKPGSETSSVAPGTKVDLRVGDKNLSMDSELASKLEPGDQVGARVSQILDRVVEVRR